MVVVAQECHVFRIDLDRDLPNAFLAVLPFDNARLCNSVSVP